MPLTEKGSKILANFKKEYGEEKGERYFYASKNKGTITGVDTATQDAELPKRQPDLSGAYPPTESRAPSGSNTEPVVVSVAGPMTNIPTPKVIPPGGSVQVGDSLAGMNLRHRAFWSRRR